ncbi:hypothetical protein GWC95_07185 [Sediminibacterium roseum]|uniref:Uncharacterized protein n=1 Tax=Sediminibacterium roseum TaxID=1978412 RepID=A0ABW9ZTV2_9BACT|nr:hypothetical protein [Sediminibacterium roseum]NCI49699.1 hypothetical protein [Sediminibacterium roseum]
MKTKILFSFLLASILVACGSSRQSKSEELVQAVPWQKDSLTIDGSDADWSNPLQLGDDKQFFSYGFSSDRNNLYIQLSTRDENAIQRILRGGLTVYINSHGVNEVAGAAGISFPTGNRVKKEGQMLNDRPELQQDKHIALNAVADYSLFGFKQVKTPENFDYGKPNTEGIELAIGLNPSNVLVYEAMIPLRSFLNVNEINTLSRRTVSIGFVVEDIPGQAGSRGGGGGFSIGGGIGLGSFGRGGGIGVSIGSDALANIGGRKKGKPVKKWNTVTFGKEPTAK